MSSGNLGHNDVKSILDSLEKSPSQHDDSGHYGGKPSVDPTAHSSTSATGKTTLPTHTSEFQMKDRSATLPNYKKRFATKAQKVS